MQMAMTAVDSCSGDAPAPCSSSAIFFAQLIMVTSDTGGGLFHLGTSEVGMIRTSTPLA